MVFHKKYIGEYIKMESIQQNSSATLFAIAYQDNGIFCVDIIDRIGHDKGYFCVNEMIGYDIDDNSKPLSCFPHPLITVCFTDDNTLFVQAYHRLTRLSYHFIYQIDKKEVFGEIHQIKLIDCTHLNFPIRSFYSEINNEIYTFYRQGNSTTVNANDSFDYH